MPRYFNSKVQRQDVYHDILTTGYHHVKMPDFSKTDYQKIYNCFNYLISLISKERSVEQAIIDSEEDFKKLYRGIFCGAPSGYRDCNKISGKRDQKEYFQYSNEYHKLFKKKYNSILEKFSFFNLFLEYLEQIDKKSKEVLNTAINDLESNVPGLKKVLFENRRELTVIIKVLRYHGNNTLCTSPHYDKSGLTVVLDNNDVENDRFIIGPHMEQFDSSKLIPTTQPRNNLNSDSTFGFLFPGACLRKAGLPFDPIPHAVLPAKTPFRYSIIAFCLVPNLDTSDIETVIINKDKFIYR